MITAASKTLSAIITFLNQLDKSIYEYIVIYSDPPWLNQLAYFLVHGRLAVYGLIIFFIFYAKKQPKKAAYLLLITLVLLGVSESTASFFKNLFERHRPVYQVAIYVFDGGYSFPSAHALNTMAFAVLWSDRFPKAAPYLFSLSIIIGLARMLANFHFPGDILGGWLLGYATAWLYVFLIKRLEEKYMPAYAKNGA